MYNANWYDDFLVKYEASVETQKGYKVALTNFDNFLNANNVIEPLESDIEAYRVYLAKHLKSAGTQNRYMRVVKQFFSYLSSKGLYNNVALDVKKAKVHNDNTKREAFTENQIKEIIDSIDTSSLVGKRDYAIILLTVTCGLRMCELSRANINDIETIGNNKVLYIQGKGHLEKDTKVKLIKEVEEALNEYLNALYRFDNKVDKTAPLFVSLSNNGYRERLSVPSLSRIVDTVFKKAGYDSSKLTAHSLRHTSNTLLFKAGADLYQVQKHARHVDPKTTEIYLHMNNWETDRSEEQILTQIYAPEKMNLLNEVIDMLKDLNSEELIEVISFISSARNQKVVNFSK